MTFTAPLICLTFKDYSEHENIYTITVLIACGAMLAFALLYGLISRFVNRNNPKNSLLTTRELTQAAVCVALSFGLHILSAAIPFLSIPFFGLQQGGAVTLASLAPITIYCFYKGFRKSIIVTAALSVLHLLWFPFIVHPLQVVLDYILPFSIYAIVGLCRNKKLYNYVILFFAATLIRYGLHVLSGIIFFAEYAVDLGYKNIVLIYSLAYNSFVLADFVIAVAAGTALASNRLIKGYLYKKENSTEHSEAISY